MSPESIILFLKSHVGGYTRRNGTYVNPHERGGASMQDGQLSLFHHKPAPLPPGTVPPDVAHLAPAAAADPRKKFYVTMIREPGPRQKVAKLAGPFDRHEDALAHVDRARDVAIEVDPYSHFDAFGTAGVTADEHRPGVLNSRLGL